MDNCYYELAQIAIAAGDIDTALNHFQYVIKYLTFSELIPQILFERIAIYFEQDKKFFAYDDYAFLVEKYPDDDYTFQAQPLIDNHMDYYLQDVETYKQSEHFNIALEKLLYLEKNPSKYHKQIQSEIADVYVLMAEHEIKASDYIKAKKYFEKSLEWDLTKQNLVDKRLNDVVDLFIKKGDELVKADDIDHAIDYYEEIFDIIPDHPRAKKQDCNSKENPS